MESSILESIGGEIIGVMSPVSICMVLVVLLVYTLSSPSSSSSSIRTAANLVYLEDPTDSTSQKLEGALLNALVFVLIISLVTFLLFLLYYYNFTAFLKYYMRFSSFFVLATMGGPIFLSLIQHFNLPVDSLTCFLLLFNFTLVGVLSIFASGFPIILRQSYMVCLGVIVAAWLTKLPEWTTWVLLVALALYDLVAVLAPAGPLKLLVDLASTRDEELPALVYEARPIMPPRNNASSLPPPFLVAGFSDSAAAGGSVELQQAVRDAGGSSRNDRDSSSSDDLSDGVVFDRARQQFAGGGSEIANEEEEMSPLVGSGEEREGTRRDATEMFSRGIKLGLGDFIFYSVLVGRAAMYDLMTVYACYLAIISGLGCTLILLSVCRQALPALPISIVLGVVFYFLTRLLMEPFVVGTSTNLLMF